MAARADPWLLRLHECFGVRQLWAVVVYLPGGAELRLGEASFATAGAVARGLKSAGEGGCVRKVGVNTIGRQS